MISIKDRPKHLYARIVSLRRDYPFEGFSLEKLELSAELDDRNVDFSLSLLLCDSTKIYNEVTFGELPDAPDSSMLYILGSPDEIIREIGCQLQVERRSKKSDTAIIDWVVLRAKEYANNRIL